MNTTNENILKLSGKVNLLEPLEMGKNYSVLISGDITTITDTDRMDGTLDRTYKFEPLTAELKSDNGQVIGTKDLKKISQKLRGRCHIYDYETGKEGSYERLIPRLIARFDEVAVILENI